MKRAALAALSSFAASSFRQGLQPGNPLFQARRIVA
jgi:hypothetical protein